MKLASAIFKTFFLSLCIIANTHFAFAQTASILPPAKTTFVDQNGKPLTAGTVDFYIPSTTTRKTTWQDAAETIPNANPVVLDAAGRALILGSGSYRQVVKDRNGNLIWDQVTSSTGSGGSTPVTATGDGDLVGTIKPWAGMTAPNQYVFTYGQELSRTTYATLMTAITSTQAVFCTSGSPILSGLSDTTNFPIGGAVEVSCLAAGYSTIVSKTSTSITLAANANVNTNVNAVIFPWGNGNHVNTFNVPDFRGVPIAGNNNMGGVASSNASVAWWGTDPNSVGGLGGTQSYTLQRTDLPNIALGLSGTLTVTSTTTGTLTGTYTQPTNINVTGATTFGMIIAGTGANQTISSSGSLTTNCPGCGTTSLNNGVTQTAFSKIMPVKTSNYIIKVTPDTNSATASGVTSLGGMTGDIACGTGLLCTGNIISVSTSTITVDATKVNYTLPLTGGVQETQSAKNSQTISIKDCGAVGDGITDDAPAIRACYNAVPNGGRLYIPVSNSPYLVNSCSANNAVIDSISTNANKSVSIYGDGWNIKTGGSYGSPLGSVFKMGASIPNTCSFLRYAPTDIVTGISLKDFAIVASTGTFGTPVGLHGVFVDGATATGYLTQFKMDHVFIDNMSAGYSLKIAGNNTSPFAGATAYSTIINNQLMNINGSFIGDGMVFDHNTMGQNATAHTRNVGIQFSQVSGATSTVISRNIFSNYDGMIVVDGAETPIIRDNELEMGNTSNANGALIDLNGSVNTVNGAVIYGNSIAQNSSVANYKPVNVANAANTIIQGNTIRIPSTYDFITVTGGAAFTNFGINRCTANNIVDASCTVSSLGPSGFQATPYAFKIPGSSGSGLATIGTQSAAGTPTIFWPTVSGTIVTSAAAPLSINSTTGQISCSTCGSFAFPVTVSGTTTSGGIPYFSNTTTLTSSALLTANALMIGGGAGGAPSTTTTGSGVLTALGINVGINGAFTTFNGAHGTPSSIALTNATGLPLTTGVTGTLPVANGGTNCSSPSGTCLDNITGFGSNGLVNKTGAGTYTAVPIGTGVSTALGNNLSANGGLTTTVASGTASLGTSAISSATCATVVTAAATNTLTTDVVTASFNGDPTAVTGYIPSTSGMLTIIVYPTANNANFKVCNNTASSITPGAITLNWRVVR